MNNWIKNITANKKSWIIISVVIGLVLAGIFILISTQQPDTDNSGIGIIGGADGPTSVYIFGSDTINGLSIYDNSQSTEGTMVCSLDQTKEDILNEFMKIYNMSKPYTSDSQTTQPMTVEVKLYDSQKTMWLNFGSQEFISVVFEDYQYNIQNRDLEDFLQKLVDESI